MIVYHTLQICLQHRAVSLCKEQFPSGVINHVHKKEWMDTARMKLWVEKAWVRRPASLLRKSLLVWDSSSAHLVSELKKQLKDDHRTDLPVIPGGLKSVVQPLDVCLNKLFKD